MTIKPFKPMLAAEAKIEDLTFPLYASAKLDGIRALVRGGVLLSRSLKPIPNKWLQAHFAQPEHEGFDGELMFGKPTAFDVYRKTVEAVMSYSWEPPAGPVDDAHALHPDGPYVTWRVFDLHDAPALTFEGRVTQLHAQMDHVSSPLVFLHTGVRIDSAEQLLAVEDAALNEGFEGLILRDLGGVYKYGRSTVKERGMLKFKRFMDAEARVVDFEEEMHNSNEAETNELGRTKRSTHKAGLTGKGTMGALVVEGVNGDFKGVQFKIGTGFTAEDRKRWWLARKALTGTVVKYKYFPIGVKDKPRHPVFLGLRDKKDLS